MEPWIWAVLLLVLGLGLAVLEVFIPSGGILGFLACSSIVAGIALAFMKGGPGIGLAILGGAVVGLPTVVILALKWLPRTAMGRRVLLTAPKSEDVLPEDQRREWLRSRVGQVAVAKCKMLPAGAIIFDGRTVDAVSEGMPIEAGQKVRVIEVRGNRVVVRAIEEETPTASAEDPLRRPIDSVAPDPFQQPPD